MACEPLGLLSRLNRKYFSQWDDNQVRVWETLPYFKKENMESKKVDSLKSDLGKTGFGAMVLYIWRFQKT